LERKKAVNFKKTSKPHQRNSTTLEPKDFRANFKHSASKAINIKVRATKI